MSRRILIPLDGSKRAEAALAVLEDVADKGDEVILLSIGEPEHETQTGVRQGRVVIGGGMGVPAGGAVVGFSPEMPVYAETPDQTAQRQLDELESYLSPICRRLEKDGFQVHMACELNTDPAEAIVDVAQRVKPTFIAMMRTIQPGIGERLFGTVAQHVIRENVAPVMILPGD